MSDIKATRDGTLQTTACDVLVIGAGPAGMCAATEAAASGARVLVIDENAGAGGQIWRETRAGAAHARSARARFGIRRFAASGARLQAQTRVLDAGDGWLTAWDEAAGGSILVRYRAIVLATGARELFLPFPGWTLPGVYGAGGLQALAKSGLPVKGLRVVVAGSGPLLLAVADYLQRAGANLQGVFEQASLRRMLPFTRHVMADPGKLLQGAGYGWSTRRSRLRTGCWPVAAHGAEVLEAVTMTDGKRRWTIACNALACGFHLVPNTELARLLGCDLHTLDAARALQTDPQACVEVDGWGRTTVEGVFCAGEPTGIAGLDAAEAAGTLAGSAAAAYAGFDSTSSTNTAPPVAQRRYARLLKQQERHKTFARALQRAFALRVELRQLCAPETIVCRCEDVTFAELHSLRGSREAKLQTRCGMGPCQGRVCGPATQVLFGWRPGSVRPPLAPAPVSALLAVPEATASR